ncbi:mannonate dehydratase [Rubellicoccus peritrichatus]|uniref:Mannonate dehydratase n=1 Tax=Rubellicoccus peritrichatus TaxID=3080537 RepID=A0AAQ3LAX8_9BACT|nr:mannonate dehydratase [Puniceicoccus sp. CR14]WOO40570.1 mannonate dehydratase [Puniceicoccus sp. CR14]
MVLMRESMRWFGPDDPVSLRDIRQCGCQGVMTALHQFSYGEAWPIEAIRSRKAKLESHELKWLAAESVPISEDIKTRTGDFKKHLENYKATICNLGAEGIDTVIYNFMPVLDWVRTDMAYALEDGAQTLYYDPVKFAIFDIYILGRRTAEADYSKEQIAKASTIYKGMSLGDKDKFTQTIIDVFPGRQFGYSIDDIRTMLQRYHSVPRKQLYEHLRLFLEEIIPVCEASGVRMAIHPDDPPWSLVGLPRIASTESDLCNVIGVVDSPSNGICLCAGSLSCREDNDLPGIVDRLGHRINALHLRSTQRQTDGSFYEATHLDGSVDMVSVVTGILKEQTRRQEEGRKDAQLAFRPDHGRVMLDDLGKPPLVTPGYTCIGRLRGLSEIRGLQRGLAAIL